jgi:hypothetical protein
MVTLCATVQLWTVFYLTLIAGWIFALGGLLYVMANVSLKVYPGALVSSTLWTCCAPLMPLPQFPASHGAPGCLAAAENAGCGCQAQVKWCCCRACAGIFVPLSREDARSLHWWGRWLYFWGGVLFIIGGMQVRARCASTCWCLVVCCASACARQPNGLSCHACLQPPFDI